MYITNVAFSTRTTDLFSNMTYKNNITMNLDTGIYFKTHKYAKIGSLVKIEKGISLDRSLLFDISARLHRNRPQRRQNGFLFLYDPKREQEKGINRIKAIYDEAI